MQFEHTALGAVGAQFASVPAEMKALRQWVVWRGIIQKGHDGASKIAKLPYRADDPSVPADVNYPHTWATFDEAVACLSKHSSVVSGIGFVLTGGDPYVCFDIDDPKKHPQMHQGYREDFMRRIAYVTTFVEKSPSGTGYHVWMRGRMPVAGRVLAQIGAEVYSSLRFITVTGDVVADVGIVGEGQGFIDTIGLGAERPQVAVVDDTRLPCDASDEQVLQWCETYSPGFRPQFAGHDLRPYKHSDAEDWSATYLSVLSILTKITGSIHQIYRLVISSGLALNCAAHSNGETRINKAQRLFRDNIARVRGDALHHRYFTEHGAQQWGNILAERKRVVEEAARMEAERVAAEEAAFELYKQKLSSLGAEGIVVEGYSSQAEEVLKQFPMLTWEHRKLTPPPGLAGRLVLSVMEASYIPDLHFSIPTTLSAISGVVGRSFRQDRGGSLNLNFLMLGKPGTGKSSAMEAWQNLVAEAMANPPPQFAKRGNLQGPLRNHIIKEKASSAHGLHLSIQDMPCAMWCIDEAAQQYNLMCDGRDKVGQGIQSLVNELYDAGRYGKTINPPSSMSTRNANMQPIGFPSVSMLWTCPPDKIDITTDAIVSGLLSRLLVIKNPSDGKEEADNVDDRPLVFGPDLKLLVIDLLTRAGDYDFYYKTPNVPVDPATVIIDTSQVKAMAHQVARAASRINIMANKETLPSHYSVFIRMAQHVMRMACILAIIENRFAPSVTGEMYRWATGYVIQNMLMLASGMDSGEVGDARDDEFKALERAFRELVKAGGQKGLPGLPHRLLYNTLKGRAPFRSHRNGRTKAVSDCLRLAISEGFLEETPLVNGQRGKYYRIIK